MRKIMQPVGVNIKSYAVLYSTIGAAAIILLIMALITKDSMLFVLMISIGMASAVMLMFIGLADVYIVRKTFRPKTEDFVPVTLLEYRYPEFSVIEDDPKKISRRIPGEPRNPVEVDEEYEPV